MMRRACFIAACILGAQPEPPAAQDGPDFNVLLVSVDTTRADHLGCYGYSHASTPNIDRFAAEGTRFAQCIASAPLTLPSHSTMLTGSYPFVHGARDNGIFSLAESNITLAEIYRDAGYATHGEVAAMVLDRRYGLGQGFDTFGDVERPKSRTELRRFDTARRVDPLASPSEPDIRPERMQPERERKADEITRRGVELLTERAAGSERFFMFLHYFDPHWPHEAPPRFTEGREGYDAELSFFDEQFGVLIDAVRDLGLAENTLVVLTADHGEGRGQHGEHTHSVFVYDTTLHVPLVMWCPGTIAAAQTVETQVRVADIAPTLVAFSGLEPTAQMQGTSLLPLVDDPRAEMRLPCYADTMVPRHSLGFAPLRTLRVDGWKYILAPRPELYDLSRDPLELFNLVRIEPERAARMKAELRAMIADAPAPPGADEAIMELDEEERRRLAALGYLSSASATDAESIDELDRFEPIGVNPRDRIEVVECWSAGLGAFTAGDYTMAERLYRRYVELEPESTHAVSYLGKCLLMLDRDDEAIAMFRRSIKLDPENYTDHRTLGNLLASHGAYAEAMTHYRTVIELNPSEVIARVNLGTLLTAQRQPDLALELFAEAVEIDSDGPQIYLQRGIALQVAARYEEAVASFKQAIALDGTLVPAHVQLAIALWQAGDRQASIEHLARTADANPDEALLHHELGQLHTVAGSADAAGERFARVVELLPDNTMARRQLGTNLLVRGDAEAAIVHLRTAVDLDPGAPVALHHLAVALEMSGASDEAAGVYERLIESAPDYAPGYLAAATCFAARGDETAAVDTLRIGNARAPDDLGMVNALAWYLATSTHDELRAGAEAVELAEVALELSGGSDATVLDTLAAAYAEARRFDDAVAAAELAMDSAREAGDRELAERIEVRRALYSDRRPYRAGHDVRPD